jgi:hypothetical protein
MPFIQERKGTKNYYGEVYDGQTKYCRECGIFIRFKDMEEYTIVTRCPCCHYQMRVRPYNMKAKTAFYKRREMGQPARY